MRIGAVTSLAPRGEEVEIGRTESGEPVVLRLLEPSLGFLESLQSQIPMPKVPQGAIRKDERGAALRTANGSRLREENRDDPAYKKALADRGQLIGVLLLLGCLEPGQVEFGVSEGEDKAAYARAVLGELDEFGVGPAGLTRLVNAANRLCVGDPAQSKAADEALGGGEEGNASAP